jgi:hypothetical protein
MKTTHLVVWLFKWANEQKNIIFNKFILNTENRFRIFGGNSCNFFGCEIINDG